mmetsp:Transcript_40709/g.117821  ORF Transcript_40709/g.117821 Transcript_40709/m.117821 type:complete len:289 (-) Transcript_40709:244-1110(-)
MFELWRFAFLCEAFGGIALGGALFGYGVRTGALPWTVAFGTSRCLSSSGLLWMNVAFATISLTMYALYLQSSWITTWPDYLTNWFITLQTTFFCLQVLATRAAIAAAPLLPDGHGVHPMPQPVVVSLANILFHVQLPLSLSVVLLYWNIVEPFSHLCMVNHAAAGCDDLPSYTNLWVHFYNPILCTASFLVGRIPFRWTNAGWLLLVVCVYGTWTVMYQMLNLDNGHPIYASIDWRQPYRTLRLLAVVNFCVFPGVAMLFWGLGKARDCRDTSAQHCEVRETLVVPGK